MVSGFDALWHGWSLTIGYHASMADWQTGAPSRFLVWVVSLVVAGLSWLTNWTEERDTARRDLYANKEDCIKDWGEESSCEQGPVARTGTGRLGYYYGPAYESGQHGSSSRSQPEGTVDSARQGSHAIGTSHVSRGGFGGSGAAHGASGS